jgi:hypothetical protein
MIKFLRLKMMCQWAYYEKKYKKFCVSLKKGVGYGSICQRYGSGDQDPDPLQNVTDPQHCGGRYTRTRIRMDLNLLLKYVRLSGLDDNLFIY